MSGRRLCEVPELFQATRFRHSHARDLSPFLTRGFGARPFARSYTRSGPLPLATGRLALHDDPIAMACGGKMKLPGLLFSALIGAVASARSMTPMASIAVARLLGNRTPGRLVLLDRPLFRFGALALGIGELFGDKMKTAPDRTVALGLLARVSSAGIAGAAMAPHGRERAGAVTAIAAAVPLAYLTLAGRERAMARMGQTRSGLIEDALIVAAAAAIVSLAIGPIGSQRTGD